MTNIILIMADQMRYDALGCTGNPLVKTPHLDRLAARGKVMFNHHTPNQICSPSRASLFSGLFPRNHGLTRNGIALGEDVELLTHALGRRGYRSHGIGKFHFQPILAPEENQMPDSWAFWEQEENADWNGPFYGFDSVDMLIGESAVATIGGHYANWLRENHGESVALFNPEKALGHVPQDLDEVWKCAAPEEIHYNRWIADRAVDFLDGQDGREPFFLFASFPDPHHPFSPPEPWCDMYDPACVPLPAVAPGELSRMPGYLSEQAAVDEVVQEEEGERSYLDFIREPTSPREQGFMMPTDGISEETMRLAIAHTYGAVSMIDDCVGQILTKLEEQGLAEDTIILFTSDHGELLGDHGLIRKGPVPYRQVLQVPMIAAGPGIGAGEIRELTSHVDLKQTLLELVEGGTGCGGDGRSFAANLRDEPAPARRILLGEYHPRVAQEQYNQTLLTDEWRLTLYPQRRDWGELFNRKQDPGEHHNLFHDDGYSAVVDELRVTLARLLPADPDAGGTPIAVY